MREIRTSGSEGGGAGQPALPTPIEKGVCGGLEWSGPDLAGRSIACFFFALGPAA